MSNNYATDYIDVAARIVEFRTKYPEGCLQPADPTQPYRVEEIGGKQRIVVVAAAYRHAEDPRPGIGMAYEEVPGRSNFTRDSELQNAETSAWGRAIVAALAADTKKGIASAEEVRNRQADQTTPQTERSGRKKKGSEPPAADAWTVPLTDMDWWSDAMSRAASAEDVETLRAIYTEAKGKLGLGHLEDEHAEALKAVMDERSADLKQAEPNTADAPTSEPWPEAAQPGSAA